MRPHTRRRGRGRGRRRRATGRTSSCDVLGRRLVFAADEYYLLAGRPFPAADAYEGFPMHEDGIGMARTFELEFGGHGADGRPAPQAGFFAVGRRRRRADADYRAATAATRPPLRPAAPVAPVAATRRSAILTGEYGARVLAPLRRAGSAATTCACSRSTTSSSAATPASPACWSARTSPACSPTEPAGHRYLLPDVCLSTTAGSSTAPRPTTCPARSRSSPPTAIALRRALDDAA